MNSYDKPLIFMLITGFLCCFVCFFFAATKQSYADIHSSLYTELESKACQILNELKDYNPKDFYDDEYVDKGDDDEDIDEDC